MDEKEIVSKDNSDKLEEKRTSTNKLESREEKDSIPYVSLERIKKYNARTNEIIWTCFGGIIISFWFLKEEVQIRNIFIVILIVIGVLIFFTRSEHLKKMRNEIDSQKSNDILNDNGLINSIIELKIMVEKEKNKRKFDKTMQFKIFDLLNNSCQTKENCLNLYKEYKSKFNYDLIEELKSLSTSHYTMKWLLGKFIIHGIVEKTYPHKLLI
jgi:hypothetical protein